MNQLQERSHIAPAFKWDLTSLFASNPAWSKAMSAFSARLDQTAPFRGHLGDSPAALGDWLGWWQGVRRELGILAVYASSQQALDTADPVAAANYSQVIALGARASEVLSFAEPELLALGVERLLSWSTQYQPLAIYRHYFETLAQRAGHVRSPEVEELLGGLENPFQSAADIHGIMADADLTFAPARAGAGAGEALPVAQGTIDSLLTKVDRETRRTAWESYADAHLAMRHSMANCLATGVKQHVFLARARRYASSLEAAVTPNHVPIEVYRHVVDTYRNNLPVWHRYWQVRHRALGVDRLHTYDLLARLGADDPKIPYSQAVRYVCQGLAPLGEEYVGAMSEGLARGRWVDVYPNRGKSAGAFSSGAPGTSPLILMSYSDDIYGVSTLAHELGHSMHSHLAWAAQPHVYAGYGIFVAEVASNVNQALVREYLLETLPDRASQIALVEEAMSNCFRYLFIMPTLARFELEIHERAERGEGLTSESMSNLLADLFAEGYGEHVEMDRERVGIIWAEFSTHLYLDFYVYQYTTGIAAAQDISRRLLDHVPGAASAYLDMLRSGDSLYPLDALRLAGVDMSTAAPIERAFADMGALVTRLAELTG